jgi:malate-CoA ligase subunit alpha
MRLIGPNCAGIISPGKGFMGIMPPHIYMPGRVGIVGRSGTLGYEAASQMKALGIGVSSSIGHRRRPDQRLVLPRHPGALRGRPRHRRGDDDRRDRRPAGGRGRRLRARSHDQARGGLRRRASAPKGRKMGHAGAIISAFGEARRRRSRSCRKRDHRRAEPLADGRDGGAHPQGEGSCMSRAETFPMVDMAAGRGLGRPHRRGLGAS